MMKGIKMITQAPTNAPNLCDLYQRLIAINHEAFTGGEYDVAYHALKAALHCVQTLHDVQGLGEVARVAEEQLACIDSQYLADEHWTPSAKKREYPSLYHTLARQAEALMQAEVRGHAPQGDTSYSEW
jgi:hypothetical protein